MSFILIRIGYILIFFWPTLYMSICVFWFFLMPNCNISDINEFTCSFFGANLEPVIYIATTYGLISILYLIPSGIAITLIGTLLKK